MIESIDVKVDGRFEQEKMMEDLIVSFCIATYQRYEVLKELIQEILSVKSNKIEVVINDDRSLDDSIEKIREIKDPRLKIYVNNKNVGSLLNICESLNRGNGKYLFYINDRDNVDPFKIEILLNILEYFEKEKVAFAKCVATHRVTEKYQIFQSGEQALIEFACKMDHPTGYIFRKEDWDKIHGKRNLFLKQRYGDYVITQICAILAQNCKGGLIYGDICDVSRRRIDFYKVKSGYYNKRSDKRLWYTPEVIFRELRIGQDFLKRLGIQENVRHRILIERYRSQIKFCVSGYERIIKDFANTAHYNFYPPQNELYIYAKSAINGMKLWWSVMHYCRVNGINLYTSINEITKQEFRILLKGREKNRKEEFEIYKREAALNTYEKWMQAELEGNRISDYLESHGYKTAAIYGMGRVGRHLLKELSDSDIRICYVIDRNSQNNSHCFGNIPCYNMNSELPYVDIIIVTISGEATDIISNLREKGKFQVNSMDDILFVLE